MKLIVLSFALFFGLLQKECSPAAVSMSAPATQPAGVDDNAATRPPRSVVYVCNGTDSMTGQSFDLLKVELKKAIAVLVPTQTFDVIFFQDGQAAAFSQQLVVANPRNKDAARESLDKLTLKRGGDPIPALRLALGLHPTLIYLLTDGPFDDNAKVIAELAAGAGGTKINTIGFFRQELPKAEHEQAEAVLKRIATDHGGSYKAVSTSDLGK